MDVSDDGGGTSTEEEAAIDVSDDGGGTSTEEEAATDVAMTAVKPRRTKTR